jgi:hypothetical protein
VGDVVAVAGGEDDVVDDVGVGDVVVDDVDVGDGEVVAPGTPALTES